MRTTQITTAARLVTEAHECVHAEAQTLALTLIDDPTDEELAEALGRYTEAREILHMQRFASTLIGIAA